MHHFGCLWMYGVHQECVRPWNHIFLPTQKTEQKGFRFFFLMDNWNKNVFHFIFIHTKHIHEHIKAYLTESLSEIPSHIRFSNYITDYMKISSNNLGGTPSTLPRGRHIHNVWLHVVSFIWRPLDPTANCSTCKITRSKIWGQLRFDR